MCVKRLDNFLISRSAVQLELREIAQQAEDQGAWGPVSVALATAVFSQASAVHLELREVLLFSRSAVHRVSH
jgi:hypothetical protein